MNGPVRVCGIEVPESRIQLFLAKIDTSAGPEACWPWTGAIKKDGYADFRIASRTAGGHGKVVKAHRVSYMLFVGGIPDEYVVDHVCHDPRVCREGNACPHRRCVNPRHLEAVTSDKNLARGAAMVRPLVPLPGTKPRQQPAKQLAPRIQKETRRIAIGGVGLVELMLDVRWLALSCDDAQRLRDAVFRFEAECREIASANPPRVIYGVEGRKEVAAGRTRPPEREDEAS